MQVLKAGEHKLLLLELDTEFIENIARQAGFEFRLDDQIRRVVLDLNAQGGKLPCCCSTRPIPPTWDGFPAASFMSMD